MSTIGRRSGERRRLLILFAALLLTGPRPSRADEEAGAPATKTLTLEAGGLVFGNHLGVEYQSALSPLLSLYVAPSLMVGWSHGSFTGVLDGLWGLDVQGGPRFFVLGQAPEGLYVGPAVSVGFGWGERNAASARGYELSLGAMAGYNWIPFQLFDVSLGAGALYRFEALVGSSSASSTKSHGVVPLVRIGVGMVF
jgi:hypothetical protein